MNIILFGAHPDDCEIKAGGTCAKWARDGHHVVLITMTNGDIGHHTMAGGPLALRRAAEARRSAERGGVDCMVLDNHDGELLPTLSIRKHVVRLIREFEADAVITHRPNDYHPDHRYTSEIVQDAAYMVTVPHFCPDVPALQKNPTFFYFMDGFKSPYPFRPDVAVDIGDAVEIKWAMLDAMESQVYEWLPWHDGKLDEVPAEAAQRLKWLKKTWGPYFRQPAKQGRVALTKWYGKAAAAKVRYAELFEISEYGTQPREAELRQLFPFLPPKKRKKKT